MFKNVLFLNLILVLNQKQVLAFHPVTENNYVLVGHVFQTIFARDWLSCIQACHDDPRCTSYNYKKSEVTNGLCELNDCGLEDLCDKDKSLIYSPGFVFQQIREGKKDDNQECMKSVPADRPQNVQLINKTSRSILITWDAVPSNQQNGKILRYKVTCSRTARRNHLHTKTVMTSIVYANLTGLSRFKNYNITVLAVNGHGDGPSSEMVTLRTDQDKPTVPPSNVTVVNKTSTSILVTWDVVPRGKRKGLILHYKVEYKAENNDIESNVVNASSRYLKIINLKKNTNYTITVSASTVKGYGPASESLMVVTDQDSPSPPQNIRAVNKTTTSIRVTWDAENGDVTSYTVNYRLATSKNDQQMMTIKTSAVNITGLSKSTNYTITVQASKKNETGRASVPIVVTTSNEGIFRCPLHVKEGIFKDPDSCFRYYNCDNDGNSHNMACEMGTEYFNEDLGSPCKTPVYPYCRV